MLSSTAENCPTTPTRTQRRDTDYTPSKKRMTNGPGTPSRAPFRTPMHFSPTRTATSETPLRPGQPLITSLAALAGTNVASSSFYTYDPEKEPIKAFLRIRPNLQQAMEKTPYMEAVSDVEVSMLPPEDSNAYRTRNRAPERYKFTKIFHEDVSQKQFFDETALPLVEDVLNGENALLFAYGVTNSGKTYSIQGTKNDSGILPRSLDVIFNSIKEYQNDSKLKPMMHSLIVPYKDVKEECRDILEHIGQSQLAHPDSTNPNMKNEMRDYENRDRTVVPIDTKFEYGIWVSYSEIYTEKIYDLLVSPHHDSKRTSLPLKYEFRGEHKYISGLTEVRVHNLQEAYAILHEGQRNRAIYSTLLNNTSSRSHSIFTIKVVRVMIEDKDYIIEDPSYATLSKLSIVDLAGSERHRNTLNSGQRLKEAGNINKSLMVLGQCMDILRLNQKRVDLGKKPAIVPFRHSKLTDLFKSSFQGDGKAVMIVNVNPYDTGFDENSHVMKFAAVAKDVATWRRVHPRLDLTDVTTATRRLRTANELSLAHDRSVLDASGENTADESDDDDTEDGSDPFVNALLAQLEEVRGKWIDAETRCATIESNIRQQVTSEMSDELRNIEAMYMASTDKENVSKDKKGANKKQMDMSLVIEQLNMKNKTLQLEVTNLKATLNDQQTTKQSLMSKIVQLENEKADAIRRSIQLTKELSTQPPPPVDPKRSRATRLESAKPYTPSRRHNKNSRPAPSSDITTPIKKLRLTDDPVRFNEFLELRRRLQRCVLKDDQLDESQLDQIIKEIETYPNVTFDLVKDTGMGKLLKLACSRKWSADYHQVEQTLRMLFRKFAKLTYSNSSLASSPMTLPSSQLSVAPAANDSSILQDEQIEPMQDTQAENSLIIVEPELDDDAPPLNEPSSDVIPLSPKPSSPANHFIDVDDTMEFDEGSVSAPNDITNPFLDEASQVEAPAAPISQSDGSAPANETMVVADQSDRRESIAPMSPELLVIKPMDSQQEAVKIEDFDITSYHNEMMKPAKRKRRLREKKALTAEEVKRISTDLGNDKSVIQ